MSLRSEIATLFARHAFALTTGTDFQALESGQAAPEDYIRFIGNVVRTHLKLPPLRALLFTLAPPDIAEHLLHNKLEEPGTTEDAGIAHSSLLKRLAAGAGLAPQLPALEALAAADIRQMIVDPLRYGTLKEVGLAALCEITELRSEHFAIGGQPVPFSGTPLPYGIMAYAPAQLVCRNQHQEPWRDRGE